MPFTLVHPVAVLLLARGPLRLLALVAGSVAPDLPYYLRATPLPVAADSWYEPYVNATASHSLEQLLPVTLPMAGAVYLCGCLLVPPLRSVAGNASWSRPASDMWVLLRRGAWVVASLLLGVLTHLLWDALTESGSDSRVLQHGSTFLGLMLLLLLAWRRRQAVRWGDPTVRRGVLALAVLGALAALTGALIASWSWLDQSSGVSAEAVAEGVLADAVKGAAIALVVASAALALAWWVLRLARSAATASGPN